MPSILSVPEDRVTQPMIRVAGEWKQVSWDEAISFTADALRRIVEQHGADSVGVLGSARATNEENYLAQKFARIVLGTNNVDCCARVCHTPTATAMKLMLGAGAATNSFDRHRKLQARFWFAVQTRRRTIRSLARESKRPPCGERV